MRLRRLPLLVASVTAIALLGACGTGPAEQETPKPTESAPETEGTDEEEPAGALAGDVNLWVYPVIADEAEHKGFWDKQIAAFNAENPDVNVKVEIYPWANRDEAITTAIASNTTPDGIYLIPDQLATYDKSLESIDTYLSADHKADILPNVVESVTIDGRMLGAPLLTSSNPLICNAKAFAEIGVTDYPSTWDELLALAPQFKEKDIYVTNYSGAIEQTLNLTFYPLLWQAGGSVFTEDGSDVAFNSPEGVKALEFVKTLVDNGWVEKDLITTTPATEQTAIADNRVACTWLQGALEVTDFWGTENVVVLDPLKEQESVAYGTVGSLSMFANSKNKEATAAFIEFATSGDSLVEYLTTAKYFSPLASTGALYADDPIFGAIEKTIPLSTVGELHANSREVQGVLAPEIQAALLGDKTPEQALKDAAEEASYLLK